MSYVPVIETGAEIKGITLKRVGRERAIELKLQISPKDLDPAALLELDKLGGGRLRLEGYQQQLPLVSAPGKTSKQEAKEKTDAAAFDAHMNAGAAGVNGAPGAVNGVEGTMNTPEETGIPRYYSVVLRGDQSHLVDGEKPLLEKALRKITGLKMADVRDNLGSLPWTVLDQVDLEKATAAKAELGAHGAELELVPWADPTPSRTEATDATEGQAEAFGMNTEARATEPAHCEILGHGDEKVTATWQNIRGALRVCDDHMHPGDLPIVPGVAAQPALAEASA